MKITLASDLEKALLRAVAEGVCQPDIVAAEELSKHGKICYESIRYLFAKKAAPPLRPTSILLTAQSLYGVDKYDFKTYLASFRELETGAEVSAILRSAREKTLLVQLINAASGQLSKGHLNVAEISQLLEKENYGTETIRAFSDDVQTKFPEPPRGIPLRSLPVITRATNGLIGVWIIGGEPGLGKTVLGFQIGIDAANSTPVFYYDLDGTGRIWLLERARRISGGSVKCFKELTRNFYLRETIATLDDDIHFAHIKYPGKPILSIIDSIQTLPTSVKFQKQSFDEWMKRFKQLSKQGCIFVCISEQNRAGYGQANMASYKGSGDIEYAGSLCVQLLQEEDADEDDPVQFHIVKNRHGKTKGYIVDLERDKKKIFWFNEEPKS